MLKADSRSAHGCSVSRVTNGFNPMSPFYLEYKVLNTNQYRVGLSEISFQILTFIIETHTPGFNLDLQGSHHKDVNLTVRLTEQTLWFMGVRMSP